MRLAEKQYAPEVETLVVTWQNPKTRTYFRIGVLKHAVADGQYSFEYVSGVESVEDFTPLVGLEDTTKRYVSNKLFPVFSERIMDERRPGFEAWLEALHADRRASPMEILSRSHGKRGSDTLQLFALPEPDQGGQALDRFFVHGVRHLEGAAERIAHLRPGQALDVIDDSTNRVDPRALIVAADTGGLGWVPGPLLGYVRSLRGSDGWRCTVEQVNPETAGSHQRLLVVVRGTPPQSDDLLKDLLSSPSM